MKTLIVISILLTSMLTQGQNIIYQFDVKDNTTYDTTCGKTTGSYWNTIDDSCEITTTPVVLNSNCGDSNFTNVPVEIRINQSGNLECDDIAIIEYRCNPSSNWVLLDTLKGCEQTENNLYSYNASCANGDSFSVRVRFITDHNTEKWQIFDGDIEIKDACVLLPMYVLSFSMEEKDRELTFHLRLNERAQTQPVLQFSEEGNFFDDVAYSTFQYLDSTGYAYDWELTNNPKPGYYRVLIEQGKTERYTELLKYDRELLGFPSLKFLGENRLKVSNLEGLAKIFITSLSGDKVKEFDVQSGEEEIELPQNLQGFYMATLYSRDEYKTIKFLLK